MDFEPDEALASIHTEASALASAPPTPPTPPTPPRGR
jgi:hypothetical protein